MIVSIPDDIYAYESKAVGNLTFRQAICLFASAATVFASFLPIYLLSKSVEIASLVSFVVAVPIFFCAIIKKEGQPFEKLIRYRLAWKKGCHQRPYRMSNLYEDLEKIEKECTHIETEATRKTVRSLWEKKKIQ